MSLLTGVILLGLSNVAALYIAGRLFLRAERLAGDRELMIQHHACEARKANYFKTLATKYAEAYFKGSGLGTEQDVSEELSATLCIDCHKFVRRKG